MTIQIEKLAKFDVLGVTLEWRLTRQDTGDQYCVLEGVVPPGVGVPPHQHPDQEAFYVLEGEGEFGVKLEGKLEWRTARVGELVNIPANALHGFRNVSAQDVRVLITCPARLGKFFEEAGTPLKDGQGTVAAPTPAGIERILEIAARHGQRFAASV